MKSALRSSVLLVLSGLALSVSAKAQETRKGFPTIFHNPLIQIAKSSCEPSDKMTIVSGTAEVFASLCAQDYRRCLLEGSCTVEEINGSRRNYSWIEFNTTLRRQTFTRSSDFGCLHGIGRGFDLKGEKITTCLDPYFTVAASGVDHPIGTVIFVPKLVGAKLPTGEIHDGYLIVRDENIEINEAGPDRFVFFSGFQNEEDIENPFVKAMLDNLDYLFDYSVVAAEKSEEVRKARAFPGLPVRTGGVK
jgi:hypothetical protein